MTICNECFKHYDDVPVAGEGCPACGKMPRSLGSLCTVCSDFSHQGAPDIRQILLSHSEGGAIVRSLDEDNCISQQKKNQMGKNCGRQRVGKFLWTDRPTNQQSEL
ncbi:hypothetical protein JZ751_001700 [Albula glossodonta]|uniref:Uncharacterized protein n=1 Tax=Albula glossodonta TaxID=121402 RepID=A0A8T2PU69_9TELE|nr:hypothetical protein JZ751_001700 [Albula glossodonta]